MMKMEKIGDQLIAYLAGEIDHCSVERIRSEIERRLQDQAIRRLMLDFSEVSFMDSSGVGMIIGRYKTMMERNGAVSARRLNPSVRRLFRMAGLHRIIAEEESEDIRQYEK